jgi:hypothetical protein
VVLEAAQEKESSMDEDSHSEVSLPDEDLAVGMLRFITIL